MIDAGKINIARLLEPVAMLWIRLALDGISHSSFSAADVLILVRFQKLCSPSRAPGMDEWRAIGVFPAPIPIADDAPLLDRLLCMTGRQPVTGALSSRPS